MERKKGSNDWPSKNSRKTTRNRIHENPDICRLNDAIAVGSLAPSEILSNAGTSMNRIQYLTVDDTSVSYHIPKRTLERMRRDGSGPRYHKCGKKILYRLDDIECWLAGRAFLTTAEARKAGVR
jgi:hypothetical protein